MAAKTRKFEDEVKDLEDIVAKIDSGELALEESIAAFERGVALVRSLNQRLDEAERRVELLSRNAEGELKSEPLDVSELDENPRTPPERRGGGGEEPPF